jgi:hypothetical protein
MSRMQTLQERWEDYRPTKTQAFWFAAGAVVITLIIGFGFAGWVTGGTAEERIGEAANNARHELAAAVCVHQFMARKDAASTLVKLKEAGWWDRNELVSKGGWATMPDRQEPNPIVASMCAARLAEMEQQKS